MSASLSSTGYSLLGWLDSPATDRGIRFSGTDGAWVFQSYQELAASARRSASRLRAAGVVADDPVLVILPNGPEFVAAFFGSMLLGAVPVPLTPHGRSRDLAEYQAHIARVLEVARPKAAVADPDSGEAVGGLLQAAACPLVAAAADGGEELAGSPVSAVNAFLQFSSGSSGAPRAVRVPRAAVESNIAAFVDWLQVNVERDALATWLPLHHDMGLVGGLVAPASLGVDVLMSRPEQFIRSPSRWLRCFGAEGATIGISPSFGLAQVLRRVRPKDLTGLDFSGWRGLVVGAERVDSQVLDAWNRLLGPFGFRSKALLPAYGMAEATLAVTGSSPDDEVRTVEVVPGSLQPGSTPVLTEEGVGISVVGCGRPVPGVQLAVIDDEGKPVAAGVVGEIEVRGDSVAQGYLTAVGGSAEGTVDFHGVLRTGDAGFLLDGELFVIGRFGDGVKLLGRWLFAEDIEELLARSIGSGQRPVVLLGSLLGHGTAVVLVNTPLVGQAETIGRTVTEAYPGIDVMVLSVRPAEIQRTSSGKPRRRSAWQSLVSPETARQAVWSSPSVRAHLESR
ncbi:AMP-binding protein [Streptacidiphilus sp. P02-A3a]|uniref:AMP-binding protein n=1 Tax=Streptacidiphilus sp. P02-A3a TaxID=2704468 RepID=UPI0015F99F7B|nr:AMP-binding protein [Streptacidiphilus sp. P02-A3a]QMU67190.1 fatty acyl-AMP ligase [Streptacidiphilus sp. P02-A3a]